MNYPRIVYYCPSCEKSFGGEEAIDIVAHDASHADVIPMSWHP